MPNGIVLARAALAAFVLLGTAPAFADGPGEAGADVAPAPARAAPLPAAQPGQALNGQSGQMSLAGGEINLNVPRSYLFYPAEVALGYLQRNSAPTPSGTVIGLIAPARARVDQPGVWATVLSYNPIGYIPGETASGLGDTNFLPAVQASRTDQGRVFEGFAINPAFDALAAGLGWAERTGAPGGARGADFRHEQRSLGRRGVAGFTSIGSADQMSTIVAALPDMSRMITFAAGRAYADFQPATDTVSNYTVPGLVTGVPAAAPQAVVDNGAGGEQTSVGGLSGAFPWIASGVIVLAAAGYLMMRRRRDPNVDPDDA